MGPTRGAKAGQQTLNEAVSDLAGAVGLDFLSEAVVAFAKHLWSNEPRVKQEVDRAAPAKEAQPIEPFEDAAMSYFDPD
jgi:hypothetical protein